MSHHFLGFLNIVNHYSLDSLFISFKQASLLKSVLCHKLVRACVHTDTDTHMHVYTHTHTEHICMYTHTRTSKMAVLFALSDSTWVKTDKGISHSSHADL